MSNFGSANAIEDRVIDGDSFIEIRKMGCAGLGSTIIRGNVEGVNIEINDSGGAIVCSRLAMKTSWAWRTLRCASSLAPALLLVPCISRPTGAVCPTSLPHCLSFPV